MLHSIEVWLAAIGDFALIAAAFFASAYGANLLMERGHGDHLTREGRDWNARATMKAYGLIAAGVLAFLSALAIGSLVRLPPLPF